MTIGVAQCVFADSGDFVTGALTQVVNITTAAGSYLHLGITHDSVSGHSVSSVASVPGLTWTAANVVPDATQSQGCEDYSSSVTAATTYAITVTFSASNVTIRGAAAKEITGSSGADAGIKNGLNQQTPGVGADAVTSNATPTLSAQPALLSGFSMDTSGVGAPAAGSAPFVSDGTGWGFGAAALCRAESKRVTATTGVAATFTAGGNRSHSSMALVFTESGGGGNPLIAPMPFYNTIHIQE